MRTCDYCGIMATDEGGVFVPVDPRGNQEFCCAQCLAEFPEYHPDHDPTPHCHMCYGSAATCKCTFAENH